MRRGYNVFPEAIRKLQHHGIEDRCIRYLQAHGRPNLQVSKENLAHGLRMMKGNGYLETLPAKFRKQRKEVITQIARDEPVYWRCESRDIRARWADLLVLSGYLAHLIMDKNELWRHDLFGFSSPLESAGTISAYIYMRSSDLEITHLQHERVLDPFGNEVLYKPFQVRSDS